MDKPQRALQAFALKTMQDVKKQALEILVLLPSINNSILKEWADERKKKLEAMIPQINDLVDELIVLDQKVEINPGYFETFMSNVKQKSISIRRKGAFTTFSLTSEKRKILSEKELDTVGLINNKLTLMSLAFVELEENIKHFGPE